MPTLPTRREILAATAWSVPAVVVTAAAPARAVSGGGHSAVTLDRTVLYPDETTTVRVTRVDDAGSPIAGEPVWLSVSGAVRAVLSEPSGVTDAAGVFETSLRIASDAMPATGTVVASSPGADAAAPVEVRKTAVVMHDATGAVTTVFVLPHGPQVAARDVENRGMSHSDLQPTGRWVRANDTIDVEVQGVGDGGVLLAFGARGPWQGFNGGQNLDVEAVYVGSGRNQLTAPRDGIVFALNFSTERVVTLVLSGGRPQPVWVKDSTTAEEFAAQLSAFADAPAVSLIGERAFVDVQRRVVDDLQARGIAWDPAEVAARLDRVLALTCEVYGLTYAAVGVARKNPGRAYFSCADSGAGYAFATDQWLCFQVDTGASEALLRGSDEWGTWHEVGHTFQTPAYTWNGLGEVTVNISSLALQQCLTGQHRLDESPETKDRIAQFFSQPVAERRYGSLTDEDPFLGLFLFDQLRQSFGENFYPAVSQVYRVHRGGGEQLPTTDQEQIDMFAQVAARVADRDLGPFFVEWGLQVSASVLSSLRAFPALGFDIWTAIDSRDAQREREVGYNLPIAALSPGSTALSLGETVATDGNVTGLTSLSGTPSSVVSRSSLAPNVGPGEGRLLALLESDDGTQELLTRVVDVTVGSALEFVGIYDIRSGWVGTSDDGTHFVATSTGVAPHDYYFRGVLYYRLTLRDDEAQVVAEVTVNGDETHDKVVQALHGVPCADGYQLEVEAAEPRRVHTWSDSQRSGQMSSTVQTFTVQGGRLAFV